MSEEWMGMEDTHLNAVRFGWTDTHFNALGWCMYLFGDYLRDQPDSLPPTNPMS